MNWVYPDVIDELKKQCHSFLKNKIEIEELQSCIYISEQKIVALEEKWLRKLLFDIENEIELCLYILDRSILFQTIKPRIEELLRVIS
ncbi:hypothetical protein PCX69_002420 [Escherichia coli]|nr:hypothetical protein [Escherichia coli]